jgi:hypothetical protein
VKYLTFSTFHYFCLSGAFVRSKDWKLKRPKRFNSLPFHIPHFVSISRSFFNSLSTSFSFWIFQMHSFVYLHFAFSIILSFSWLIYSFSPVLLNLYCPFNLIIYVVLLGNVLFSVWLSLSRDEVVWSNNVLSKLKIFFRNPFLRIFFIFGFLSNKRSFEIINFERTLIDQTDWTIYKLKICSFVRSFEKINLFVCSKPNLT